MKPAKSIRKLHAKAPRRLVTAWRDAGCSDRRLAELIGVNHFYVSQLLWRGIEPTNMGIRVKLFLPAKPRKPREEKPEEWTGQERVRKNVRMMHRDTTHAYKRRGEIDKEFDHVGKGD